MSLKRNLDELVYETICQGFVGGAYTAGMRLDPAELSEQYQVSKTPVIQALKRMAHERIVEITSGGICYTCSDPAGDRKCLPGEAAI